MNFKELGLHKEILEAISYMNFKEATPIQEQAIPKILANKDLIACAQTGTGKTAAFLLPILDKLAQNPSEQTNTLILSPTRELAIQIEQQLQGLAYFCNVSSATIYGGKGTDWAAQRQALTQGANVIVATPGKLISHLSMGYVQFGDIQHLVLDEADRMLDMGFLPDIRRIVSYLPENRQTLMFSATMAKKIRYLAKQILKAPEEITLALSKPAEGVVQVVYGVEEEQKVQLIHHLLKNADSYTSILILVLPNEM